MNKQHYVLLQQEETYHEKMGHNASGRSLRHRLIKRLRFIPSDSASSAAESNPSETTTTAEGTKEDLIFVNYRDIRDLNPHLYAGEMYAQEMLYEGLVNITSDGFEGCLAESWDVSDDGKVYTFHIRPGVTFSDGEKCDAYAIKANFDAILENKDRHTWLEMMHLLVGVDAPDENTFCD